ncbi:TIR domain-containing protein [Nocardia takedensis]|uniref:TIR domain-containing protein n=1 Tax=Nocardia takedensis TaxID=259390 RepID=UPI000A04DA98|nr:TIR domain-containing protein [Nocardia takedensis]
MSHYSQRQLLAVAQHAAARKADPSRHKCFISYHAEDTDEVATFLDSFGSEFIAKTIGVTDEDDFIDSDDTEYIMRRIRQDYLGDSTVTIVLVGKCTWARRYVDWEVYSSLRASKHSSVNGLLAIELPSVAVEGTSLPPRVGDNIERDVNGNDLGYARYVRYPTSAASIRTTIDDAFAARTSRSYLVDNTRPRKQRSSSCG